MADRIYLKLVIAVFLCTTNVQSLDAQSSSNWKDWIRRGKRALTVVEWLLEEFGSERPSRLPDREDLKELQWIPDRVPVATYDPAEAIKSRIYDQAELIRASGDAAVAFANARKTWAEAKQLELENWEQAIRKEWEMKLLAEKKKQELEHVRQIAKIRYLNKQKLKNSVAWEKLKNHPELSGVRIRSGAAHNFLLERLSVSALPYEYDAAETRYGPEALQSMSLDKEWLGDITLAQEEFRFPANKDVQAEIDQWPHLLRWEEFSSARTQYETARQKVLLESDMTGLVSVESIREMHDALRGLTKSFYESVDAWRWARENYRYAHHYAARRHLALLDREISRLQETGDIRPFKGRSGYDPNIHGEHLISLLTFMNRNGLKFAPAEPGHEAAYYQLFVMMRALYLTSLEDDSLSPQTD